ncbi:hypothetical protein OIU77_020519 [Salix suchowensis]|uniref:Photosystem II protein L n=1 Tax=Salix suchowensis TaxID=1278906 RepID=A0ABQ9C6R8_9ROSI|nr:hypothetical protein OIU77_020519 [Salix suchowensis]
MRASNLLEQSRYWYLQEVQSRSTRCTLL